MSPARAMDEPASALEIAAIADRIHAGDLRATFTRSGGPGGQNVNKVNTRVTLLLDLQDGSSFTSGEVRRIRNRLATRFTAQGCLRVVSSRHRTQRANREAALDRLCALIAVALRHKKTRKPTRVSANAKRKRLNEKRRAGEKKRERTRPTTDRDAW